MKNMKKIAMVVLTSLIVMVLFVPTFAFAEEMTIVLGEALEDALQNSSAKNLIPVEIVDSALFWQQPVYDMEFNISATPNSILRGESSSITATVKNTGNKPMDIKIYNRSVDGSLQEVGRIENLAVGAQRSICHAQNFDEKTIIKFVAHGYEITDIVGPLMPTVEKDSNKLSITVNDPPA